MEKTPILHRPVVTCDFQRWCFIISKTTVFFSFFRSWFHKGIFVDWNLSFTLPANASKTIRYGSLHEQHCRTDMWLACRIDECPDRYTIALICWQPDSGFLSYYFSVRISIWIPWVGFVSSPIRIFRPNHEDLAPIHPRISTSSQILSWFCQQSSFFNPMTAPNSSSTHVQRTSSSKRPFSRTILSLQNTLVRSTTIHPRTLHLLTPLMWIRSLSF